MGRKKKRNLGRRKMWEKKERSGKETSGKEKKEKKELKKTNSHPHKERKGVGVLHVLPKKKKKYIN